MRWAGPRSQRRPAAGLVSVAATQTEERILAAAQHLFAERGFHAVSVRDIAAKAGVSHALVHRYLGSKKAILTAVMKRHTGPVLGVARAAASVREAVPGMFRELRGVSAWTT